MGVMFNHAVGMMTSPIGIWFLAMVAVAVLAAKGRRKSAWWVGGVATAVLWVFSCGWSYRIIGGALERPYPPVAMEDVPKADAIVILGGGMGANPKVSPYAEMYPAADRVWHAARLWKAGKAPVVMASGVNELLSTKPLLQDFGLPESAIHIENESRNTEENAKFVARLLEGTKKDGMGGKPKILLVTSAWHMRRSLLMFRRYAPGLEVIAAPCDHEGLHANGEPLAVNHFFPVAEVLMRNGYMVKEIVGYYGYKWFR